MLKIGEFSKLSHLTVKALRFYEKEGILQPASIDEWTGYRFYETAQLVDAAKIKAYRQLGLSIDEIKEVLASDDPTEVLRRKAEDLETERKDIDIRIAVIKNILEEKHMKYQVTEKVVPAVLVYYAETVLEEYKDMMGWIPAVGEACMELNPGIKCAEPPYEFCEYPDGEFKEKDIQVRHNEAVTSRGKESDLIKFRELPETKVLSIFHKGSYDSIGEAYAFIMEYAEKNGYQVTGLARECYIDGIWNKESEEDWLTEIQLPIQ